MGVVKYPWAWSLTAPRAVGVVSYHRDRSPTSPRALEAVCPLYCQFDLGR